jgi:hypothetical protein
VVLDGQTARTETGCSHGISWFAANLGAAVVRHAVDREVTLQDALARAIAAVAGMHATTCDLTHPATPSAFITIARINGSDLEHLVLGDVTLAIERQTGVHAITDDRVDNTARAERDEADLHAIGSQAKQEALLRMKHAELTARNTDSGYWTAAADPNAASHALIGRLPMANLIRFAIMSDGAARIVKPFGLITWRQVLDDLSKSGPAAVIRRVRAAEAADPDGINWPRNKRNDDATVVFAQID